MLFTACKVTSFDARCLLGFLATHDCFSLFFLHMHVALQNFVVFFSNFFPEKKGLDLSCVLHRWHPTGYLTRSKYGNTFFQSNFLLKAFHQPFFFFLFSILANSTKKKNIDKSMHTKRFLHLFWFLVLAFGGFLVSLFGYFLVHVSLYSFSKYKIGSLVTHKQNQETNLKPTNK